MTHPSSCMLVLLFASIGTDASASPTSRVLDLDELFFGSTTIEAATQRAGGLAAELETCRDLEAVALETCLLDRLLGANGLKEAEDDRDPRINSMSGALNAGEGSCAALGVLVLALTQPFGAPFEALVLRDHVMVVSSQDRSRLYEVSKGGTRRRDSVSRKAFPPGGPVAARFDDFLPYYLDNLAARFSEAGDDAKAEAAFTRARELGPRVARIHYNYGTFLTEQGDPRGGARHLTRAIALGWADADAYANRGAALMQLGKVKGARRDFERALALKPGHRAASANLKRLDTLPE